MTFICTARGRIPVGKFVSALRSAIASTPGTWYPTSFNSILPADREEIINEWRSMMHLRINERIPWFGKGALWFSSRQAVIDAARARRARRVNRLA